MLGVPDHLGSHRAEPRRGRHAPAQDVRILVPVTASRESEFAVDTAARLASERSAVVTLVHVIEVPKELPLDALFPEEEAEARRILNHAAGILDRYGVHHKTQSMRASTAAAAILDAARDSDAQILVMGAPRITRRKRTVFGPNVATVLRRASCRVMLVTSPSEMSASPPEPVGEPSSEFP